MKKKIFLIFLIIALVLISIYLINNREIKMDHNEKVHWVVDGILEKYGYDPSFKDILRYGSENFTYDGNLSLGDNLLELSKYIGDVKILYDNRENIPDGVIKSVLYNPENFIYGLSFVRGYELEKDLSRMDISLDIPYIMQTDPKWGHHPYGLNDLGRDGCGPTSLSMVLSAIKNDRKLSPKYLKDLSIDLGHYVEGSGTSWSFMEEVPKKLGFNVREIPLDRNIFLKALDGGELLILSLGPGDFTRSGHFVVVTSYEDEGLHILDPNSWVNSEKLWPYSRLEGQIKNIWAFK